MRGYLKSFLLLFILCCTGPAWAVGVNEACDSDNKCDAGLYCETIGGESKCVSCKDKTDNKYPNSNSGAINIAQCYKSCGAKEDIKVNGVKLGTKTPKQSIAYYNNECTYNITCNSAVAQESGNTCTGKCFELTLQKSATDSSNNKYLYFKYADGLYKNNNCTQGYNPATDGASIIHESGWYYEFKGYYSSKTDGNKYFDASGTPQNITFDIFTQNTILYGQWTENNCKITYMIDDTQYGAPQICHYPRNGQTAPTDYKCTAAANPNKSKEGQELKNWGGYAFGATIPCDANHPATTLNAEWGACSAGYYCTATDGRKTCPAGATSASGASQKTQCYMSSETQFRDKKNGTFTLPIGSGVKIYYK